jgi:hypothetical protein
MAVDRVPSQPILASKPPQRATPGTGSLDPLTVLVRTDGAALVLRSPGYGPTVPSRLSRSPTSAKQPANVR